MNKRSSIMFQRGILISLVSAGLVFMPGPIMAAESARVLRAGAAAVDITPQELPVRVAGNFFEQLASEVEDRLHARCLTLDNGQERVAIAVVDSCVIPRDLFDQAKRMAGDATGIPVDRILISATHTHSGPTLDAILGSDGNSKYRQWLPGRIAQTIQAAVANLGPARIGWTVVQDVKHTHCRQWIRRPDRIDTDPFGYQSIRSMMHPGYQNPDYLGPAGPAEPSLSIVSVQTPEQKPIALLANYSMHYVGAKPLSADYFGAFADKIAELTGTDTSHPPFVAIMSNGTSGDQHWMDYSQPKPTQPQSHIQYAETIAREVYEACKKIEHHDWIPIAMRERALTLKVRPISDEELAKAKKLAASLEGRKPETLPQLYALEQVQLSQMPTTRELKLQALSIGGLGIVAIPCEAFGITGLKIKAFSPLNPTLIIELANGYEGYLPPPAQHPLGGYTTWRAKSSCLEVNAEPVIVTNVIELLEEVSGKSRRLLTSEDYPLGEYPQKVLASKPLAYWRLNEFDGTQAVDVSGNDNHGTYEAGVVFYLDGPTSYDNHDEKRINRAPQCAGGRIKAKIKGLSDAYAIEMWFKNYLPVDARAVTGYMFSRGPEGAQQAPGDHLGLGGKVSEQGKLLFYNGDTLKQSLHGKTDIPLKTWNHVVMVRDGMQVVIYLNGNAVADISGEAGQGFPANNNQVFIGGRNDGFAGFEGRIDEVSIYGRPLSADEVVSHYQAANVMGSLNH